MRNHTPRLKEAIGLFSLLVAIASADAADLEGRVVGVSDGDSITVLDAGRSQHKIRLAGIDAPERGQAFGTRSKQNLSGLVHGQSVRVEWDKVDRYGRKVGKVMVAEPNCREIECPKTLDAGMAQLTVGLAWWYREYAGEQSTQDRGAYEFAETEAQARMAGLWRDADRMAPWEWRKQKRAR